MSKRDILYKNARKRIYNKDLYLKDFIDDFLNKTLSMFHYENFPSEIPVKAFDRYLFLNGYCAFTKIDDKFYVFDGALCGLLNEYYEYDKILVNKPTIKIEKEFTDNIDCVICRNDYLSIGMLPIIEKNSVLCNDSEITVNIITNILRSQLLISASDTRTRESADLFVKKLFDGELATIAENQFFDGVKVHNVTTNSNFIQQCIELNQYLKATAYNSIGLDANFNMKRERLSESEVELNNDVLIPLAENMLECRKESVDRINKMYNLNIKVDLSSVWKRNKELVDKSTVLFETETETENKQDGNNDNK